MGWRTRILLVTTVLACAGGARAQTKPPVTDDAVQTPSLALPNTPPTASKPLASVPALEPLAQVMKRLADRGVLVRASLTDEYGGNLSGGVRQGSTNTGLGLITADADLQRLVGWKGAKVHAMLVGLYGKSIAAEYIGNAIKEQGSYFFPQPYQLAQLTLEQDLLGGKLNVVAGRTNATGYFAKPTYGCQFLNGSQCPYYLPLTTGGFSGYPYVTWGGRVSVEAARNVHVSAGVFSIDPTRRNRHGFDLFDTDAVSGFTVPFQVDYGTDFSNDSHPRHFVLGGWYNSADYNDPYLNAAGKPRAYFPGAPLVYDGGRGGVFALADQVVWRPDPTSRRNLAVFGSFTGPLDNREVLQAEATGGFLFTGPFKSRPRDTFGLEATYLRFTGKEGNYLNDLLTKAGSPNRLNRNELMVEVNYGYEVIRGLKFTPSVQYIVNPDTTALSTVATRAPDNAFVLAMRVAVNFGDLLGLPLALPQRKR
jgi:porin